MEDKKNLLIIEGIDLSVGGETLRTEELQYACLSCGKVLNHSEYYKLQKRLYFSAPQCRCGSRKWRVSYKKQYVIIE